MAFLEVNNIDVFYGDVQVIFELSLHVEEGEVVSIIGGNGAGKSTLLRSISGLVSIQRKGKSGSRELRSTRPRPKRSSNGAWCTYPRGGGCLPS